MTYGKWSKKDIFVWIYQYLKKVGIPADSEIPAAYVFQALDYQIKAITCCNQHGTQKLVVNSLQNEIREVLKKHSSVKNPISAAEIHQYSDILQQERQVAGVTNLLKGLVDSGEVIKIPRPNSKIPVKYYLNPQYNKQ